MEYHKSTLTNLLLIYTVKIMSLMQAIASYFLKIVEFQKISYKIFKIFIIARKLVLIKINLLHFYKAEF